MRFVAFILFMLFPTLAHASGCGKSSLNACSDNGLCRLAVDGFRGNYAWSKLPTFQPYVREAKRRGLNCVQMRSLKIPSQVTHSILKEEFYKLNEQNKKSDV